MPHPSWPARRVVVWYLYFILGYEVRITEAGTTLAVGIALKKSERWKHGRKLG